MLIILRDLTRNRLVPTRWATIKMAVRIGQVYYFEYLLEDLVKYPEEEDLREQQIADVTARFGRFHNWLPGTSGAALGAQQPSVFRSAAGLDLQTASGADLEEWGNTVAAVATSETYREVEFLKVLGLFDLKGQAAPVTDENFILRSNTVYQLRVFQTVPVPDLSSNVTPHDIDVVTFSDHFVFLRPRLRAVGKYDMLNFVLKTRRLPPKERSAIEIPHIPHHLKGGYAPSALYMPILTRGRSPVLVAAWLAIVVACLVLMFRPSVSPGDPTTVRNVATVLFILLISGWRTTATALFPSLPWAVSKP